jgi:hypothetical protein
VQTFSNRHLTVGLDGIVEMSEEDAACLIPAGWIKLADKLRRRSSMPPDAASQVPKLCEPSEIRSAPRETGGTEGSNPSPSSGECANPRSLSRRDALGGVVYLAAVQLSHNPSQKYLKFSDQPIWRSLSVG